MKRTRVHRRCARGFTWVELVVCVLALILLIAIFLPHPGRSRRASITMKDSSQVRGVLHAFVLFAQSNSDQYPLPSVADANNDTVPELGTAKDTSANIYSMMMWNGFVTAELLVSPQEAGNVEKYEGYELSSPQAAVNPAKAQWDPAFRADFTGKEPGGVSYAHTLPGGARKDQWSNTFKSTEVVIANRGPKVKGVTYKDDGSIDTIDADKKSLTYLYHRPYDQWVGNIGYNDNHVKFEQDMTGSNITYRNTTGSTMADLIFFDEPDDPTGTNAFLSIFTTAGDKRSDFTSIWD